MNKLETIRYIICDDDESKFYQSGSYFTGMILSANLYEIEEEAEYHFTRALNYAQRQLFTKIIVLKFTVTKEK